MPRDDARELHDEVVDLLAEWEPTFQSYTVAEERMQIYLDRALNPDPVSSVTDAIETPHAPGTPDIVVNGVLGINIYRQFTRGEEYAEFRALLDDCDVDYLIMYAYDLPMGDSSRDQWQFTKSKYAGATYGMAQLTFVHHIPGTDEGHSRLRQLLEYPEALLFGVLSTVVAVALIVGTLTGGGRSLVGGPVVTGVTSLVLVVFLILLWGTTEDV